MIRIVLVLISCLLFGAAFAKEKQEAQAAPTVQEKPAHAEKADKAKAHDAAAREKATAPEISKKAYLRLLAAELRRHTPRVSQYPAGSASVTFTIGASGRVVSQTIKHASDPALKDAVRSILASVKAPPPPGGSFVATQEFTFH